MRISKFRIYKAIIAVLLGIAVAIAITTNTAIIALLAVVVAIAIAVILERSNKEIVRDERISQISRRAASASFNSIIILAAIAALGIALFRQYYGLFNLCCNSIAYVFLCLFQQEAVRCKR
jgi:uncharacterized membrane protein